MSPQEKATGRRTLAVTFIVLGAVLIFLA